MSSGESMTFSSKHVLSGRQGFGWWDANTRAGSVSNGLLLASRGCLCVGMSADPQEQPEKDIASAILPADLWSPL